MFPAEKATAGMVAAGVYSSLSSLDRFRDQNLGFGFWNAAPQGDPSGERKEECGITDRGRCTSSRNEGGRKSGRRRNVRDDCKQAQDKNEHGASALLRRARQIPARHVREVEAGSRSSN